MLHGQAGSPVKMMNVTLQSTPHIHGKASCMAHAGAVSLPNYEQRHTKTLKEKREEEKKKKEEKKVEQIRDTRQKHIGGSHSFPSFEQKRLPKKKKKGWCNH